MRPTTGHRYALVLAAGLAACADQLIEPEPGGDLAVEEAFPGETGELRTGTLETEDGVFEIQYRVIRGERVLDGDILLGPEPDPGDLETPDGVGVSQHAVAGIVPSARWPGGVIPYEIEAGFPGAARVHDAISHWNANTTIRLVPRSGEANFAVFVRDPGDGCASNMGMIGGPQTVRIGDSCSRGNVIHEIGHLVGLFHEHSRMDRDQHITIYWGNIEPDGHPEYRTYVEAWNGYDIADDIGAYDTGSIMHYSSCAFAISRTCDPQTASGRTMLTKDGRGIDGQRERLSAGDIMGVRAMYPAPDAPPWRVLPGYARDLAVGASGSAWLIGTNQVAGGGSIFYWTGSNWNYIDGGAVRIAVDPWGNPWVVNDAGNIFRRENGRWIVMPGYARDIGIGANGAAWVIGTNQVPGGGSIFYWTGSSWNYIDGGAVRIAVDPWGNPWVVNDAGNIFRRENGRWIVMPGLARDIGIGANGLVWIIGRSPMTGGYNILHWNGRIWNPVDGSGVAITVDNAGRPWIANNQGNVFLRRGNHLVADHSGRCADVAGISAANGAALQQWTCWGGANQEFTPVRLDDGSYALVAGHTGKCLDVGGWSQANGGGLIQWDCHWGDNQRFWLRPQGPSWEIVAKHSGKCMDVAGASGADGAVIHQWDCLGALNQRWSLR